jgi:alkylated DNA repair protein (DNA oxidative demethylase)
MAARLFEDLPEPRLLREALGTGTAILNGFAHGVEAELVSAFNAVVERAPLRHMVTPGGFRMSVAMTNCGNLGWVTDRKGYRYDEIDPETGLQWPAMPPVFARLAAGAAPEAGYSLFLPDACLINWYEPGVRLSLHQDKNERDFDQPIVSVSLGLPAIFQFGGLERSDTTIRIPLIHNDVIVCVGESDLTRIR